MEPKKDKFNLLVAFKDKDNVKLCVCMSLIGDHSHIKTRLVADIFDGWQSFLVTQPDPYILVVPKQVN